MVIDPPKRCRRRETFQVAGRWVIVIHPLPIGLGFLVQLEDGAAFRGPFLLMLLGKRFAWWWRPDMYTALGKGFDEAEAR